MGLPYQQTWASTSGGLDHENGSSLGERLRRANDRAAQSAQILTDPPVTALVTLMTLGLTRFDIGLPRILSPVHEDLGQTRGFLVCEFLPQRRQ